MVISTEIPQFVLLIKRELNVEKSSFCGRLMEIFTDLRMAVVGKKALVSY
jgi:hypothetical protein